METTLILDPEAQNELAHLDDVLADRPAEETGQTLQRLEGISVTIRLAPDAKVTVNGQVYSRTAGNVNEAGYGRVPGPAAGWQLSNEDPYQAYLELNGDLKPCVRWLVHQRIVDEGIEDGCCTEHPLTAFHIKVDEEGNVYCLAQYASLEHDSECITCPNGMVVCGVNPKCRPD